MTWKYFGEWEPIPIFQSLFWMHPYVNEGLLKHFHTRRTLGVYTKDKKAYLFLDSAWLSDLRDYTYSTPPKKIVKELQTFYPRFRKIKSGLYRFYGNNYSKCSDKGLIRSLEEILKLIRDMTPYDQYSMISEIYHLERFHKELKKHSKNPEHTSILCSPTRLTTTQEEELSLINLTLNSKKNKKLLLIDINRHLYNYGWLPVFLFGKSWDEEYVITEAHRLKDEDLELKRKQIMSFPKEQEAKIKELHKKLGSSNNLIELSKVMQEISFIRNEAETMISLGTFILRPIFLELTKRTGLKEEEWSCLTSEEITKILTKKKDFKEEIEKRLKASFYISSDTLTIYTESIAMKIFKKSYIKPKQKNKSELIGMCASVGTATGKVCIVKSLNDMHKFKEGDILVAEATCIDYVPIMRRACAIVTEMGGITSHAAIVSRELKVPCIVGIPGLLKTLKNGQIVKVDASSGTVNLVK